jgi:hypothetical protein
MRKQVEAWQRSELTDVTAKVVIYEAFVEGKLEAPKHLARTVHDLYLEPKYEEFQPNDLESLERLYLGVQGAGSCSSVQGDCKAGRVPGGEVLASVLRKHGGAARTADLSWSSAWTSQNFPCTCQYRIIA